MGFDVIRIYANSQARAGGNLDYAVNAGEWLGLTFDRYYGSVGVPGGKEFEFLKLAGIGDGRDVVQ